MLSIFTVRSLKWNSLLNKFLIYSKRKKKDKEEYAFSLEERQLAAKASSEAWQAILNHKIEPLNTTYKKQVKTCFLFNLLIHYL